MFKDDTRRSAQDEIQRHDSGVFRRFLMPEMFACSARQPSPALGLGYRVSAFWA